MMFRRYTTILLGFSIFLYFSLSLSANDQDIRLNSLGFLVNQTKQATVIGSSTSFHIIRTGDSTTVFQGILSDAIVNQDTQESGRIADFSTLKETGTFRLVVSEIGQSTAFAVGDDLYQIPFTTVMKGMYLWRCGTAVSAVHRGILYAHDACHLDDGYLDFVGEKGAKKDALKGWHDAGDYNKYIVNTGVTVGAMFQAWEQFPSIHELRLELPASETANSLPDFLDEMKWEMEWVLAMQASDGSVYHKLSTTKFGGFIMPETEKEKRYFTSWGSAATADFVAMTAMASRIFEPYDPAFSQRCRDAALQSYSFLVAHPDDHRPDLQSFSTGEYQTRDSDDRLWAAAEMWQTFGETQYLQDFENRARNQNPPIDTNWDWGNVKNLGMFTYLLSSREGKNPDLSKKLQDALLRNADDMVKTGREHGYGRPLGTLYYWGCNGTVARQCMNLMVANRLSPNPDYVNTALAALDHLFGRNYYCRSFVTGLGLNPPLNPHDRRSGGDTIREPWPGYLIGGGHTGTNWKDEQEDYRTNEIAINWNGALVYALAAFVNPSSYDLHE